MHYYQHHIGDFIRDTSRLSDSQCMTYLRLLWIYYESEQPLTSNINVLSLKVGGDEAEVFLLLEAFFVLDGNVYRHVRCDKEIANYQKLSEGGKQGAAKRWAKATNSPPIATPLGVDSPPIATPLGVDSPPNSNHKPITNNQEPINSTQEVSLVGGNKSPREKNGSKLPSDWFLPKSWGDWAFDNRPELGFAGIRLEADKFRDHWHANANQRSGKKSNWEAAWRNWIRNARPQTSSAVQNVQQERLNKAQQQFGAYYGTDSTVIDVTPVATIEANAESIGRIGISIR